MSKYELSSLDKENGNLLDLNLSQLNRSTDQNESKISEHDSKTAMIIVDQSPVQLNKKKTKL